MVSVRRGRLVGVELPPVEAPASTAPQGEAEVEERAAPARWTRELEAYFRGERLCWKAEEIPLDDLGAGEFRRAVYEVLLSIPPGETVSYGALAEMAGHPRAARAVGTAMATNPLPIVIPCHRVIRSDGSLGNYGSDPSWKERLLSHERQHRRHGGT